MLALNLPKPKKVKANLLVLGAAKVAVFGVDEVKATARAYKTEAEIFDGMGHDMMLEPEWRSVAERIVGWHRKQERGKT
jgi:alpha-beta hydrolase superfamily lysophospholipase